MFSGLLKYQFIEALICSICHDTPESWKCIENQIQINCSEFNASSNQCFVNIILVFI